MSRQLVLIPASGADWRLDERTRETGRKGVAKAREVLRLADEQARRAAGVTGATSTDDAPSDAANHAANAANPAA